MSKAVHKSKNRTSTEKTTEKGYFKSKRGKVGGVLTIIKFSDDIHNWHFSSKVNKESFSFIEMGNLGEPLKSRYSALASARAHRITSKEIEDLL